MKRLSLLCMTLLLALTLQAGNNGRFFKKLSGQNVTSSQAVELFSQWFSLPSGTEWREVSRTTDPAGMERIEYRQYVLGVEVENSQVLLHVQDGLVRSANGTVMEKRLAPAKLREHSPIYKSGTPTDAMGQQLYLVNTKDGYRYAYKVLSAPKHEWVYYDADTEEVVKRVGTRNYSEPQDEKRAKAPAKTIYSGDVELDVTQYNGFTFLYDQERNIHTLNAAYLPTYYELANKGLLYEYFPQLDMPDNFWDSTPGEFKAWKEKIEKLAETDQLVSFPEYIFDHTQYITNKQGEYMAYRVGTLTIDKLMVKDESGNLVPYTPKPKGSDDDDDNFSGDDDDFGFGDDDDLGFGDDDDLGFGDDDDDGFGDDDDDGFGDDDDDDEGPLVTIQLLYGANPSRLSKGCIENFSSNYSGKPFDMTGLYDVIPQDGATLLVMIEDINPYMSADTLAVIPIVPNKSGLLSFSNERISLTLDYEPAGDPVADIHWGMARTLDYYKDVFGRNGYDGKGAPVYNLVYNLNEDEESPLAFDMCNAAAISTQKPYPMMYGLGALGLQPARPVVELSVMAHEFTHIITGHTAKLEYQGESGALNESFSDIFGIAVKKYVTHAADWNIGAGVMLNMDLQPYSNLRDMATPENSMDGDMPIPSTYGGKLWTDPTDLTDEDHGGVHTNSGVQNKWFYLLTDGGQGVNDLGTAYNVEGIGIEKSQQIAYLTLCSYATMQSDYAAIREASLEAAGVLYGANSKEQDAVADAWNAVGVEPAPEPSIDAVATIPTKEDPANRIYDLQGRRLSGFPTQHGVYIIHGKKTVIP